MPDPKIKWQSVEAVRPEARPSCDNLANIRCRYAKVIETNIIAALKNKEENPSFEEIDMLIKGYVVTPPHAPG